MRRHTWLRHLLARGHDAREVGSWIRPEAKNVVPLLPSVLIRFVKKHSNTLVNNLRERACSRSVSLAPRTGRELFSEMEAKSP
jgi:hypothetical protein